MNRTKHTLREIIERLHAIGLERPKDQDVIVDVVNIIEYHIKLMNQLKLVKGNEKVVEQKVLDVAMVENVLYNS